MDTTEKYIEMCKAKEIQSRWRPIDGDFYVYSIVVHYPHVYTEGSKLSAELMNMNKDNWIWLPRQDQLRGMLSASITIGYMVCGLDAFFDPERYCANGVCEVCKERGLRRRTAYDTMEQWWLGFVMHEKFGKWWNMEKSEWIECDDEL